MSTKSAPWTSNRSLSLTGVPQSQRVYDVLDVGWQWRLKSLPSGTSTSDARRGFWANCSQAIQRAPFFEDGGVITTSGCWYTYEHDFCLDGHDFVLLQGAPIGTTPASSFSARQLRDLGAEAFSAPCISCFTYAAYLNPYGSWWQSPKDHEG
jgi:hypothetical protein